MIKRLKITALLILGILAPTQIKAQEQYDQAKEFIQKQMNDAQRNYPVEYQAAKTGFAYGALAGATKSFIPGVPKRGKGFISCTLIGAAVGSCANVVLNRNASYLVNVKNKLEYAFSEEGQKDISAQVAQTAVQALQSSPDGAKNNALENLATLNQQSEQNKEDKDLSATERADLFKKIACLTAFLFA